VRPNGLLHATITLIVLDGINFGTVPAILELQESPFNLLPQYPVQGIFEGIASTISNYFKVFSIAAFPPTIGRSRQFHPDRLSVLCQAWVKV